MAVINHKKNTDTKYDAKQRIRNSGKIWAYSQNSITVKEVAEGFFLTISCEIDENTVFLTRSEANFLAKKIQSNEEN